jgi:Ferric reductase like transmembrane component
MQTILNAHRSCEGLVWTFAGLSYVVLLSSNYCLFLHHMLTIAPMCWRLCLRSAVTFLLGISWDRLIKYHRWFAYLMAVPLTWHGYCYHLYTRWHKPMHFTGNVLYTAYIALALLSLPCVRTRWYELFYRSHLVLSLVIAVFGVLHSVAVLEYAWLALLLYAADIVLRWRKSRQVS